MIQPHFVLAHGDARHHSEWGDDFKTNVDETRGPGPEPLWTQARQGGRRSVHTGGQWRHQSCPTRVREGTDAPLPGGRWEARSAVTAIETDRVAVFRQLHAAQESLPRLGALLAAGDGSVDATLVRGPASAAQSQVDEAVRLLALRGEPSEVARVACAFCKQMIMPAATLCGFCWHKRQPTGR